MFLLPTQKQSIWQTLKNSLSLWKSAFKQLILLALACAIITTIPHYFIPEYYYPHFIKVLRYIAKHPYYVLTYFL